MKTTFNHWYNVLAAFILSLLGFSSCDGIGGDEPCLYGTPTCHYQLKGNVTTEDGTPIGGIKVVFNDEEDSYRPRLDSAYTDTKGNYVTRENTHFPNFEDLKKKGKLKVILGDVDGEAHGGEFATDTIKSEDITIKQVGKGSGWDEGVFEITANGKMKKKK